MGILEEWFFRIIQLVVLFLATSLIYDNYRATREAYDKGLVLSFGVILSRQALILYILGGQIFFKLTGYNTWYPIIDNSLQTLFYLLIAYTAYSRYAPSWQYIRRTVYGTLAGLIAFTGLMLYYWRPYAYSQIPFSEFWGSSFFEIFHITLVLAIIFFLFSEKKGLFKSWLQGAFYILLLAHVTGLAALLLGKAIALPLTEIGQLLILTGYLTLAFSQIKPRIQAKFILALVSVVIFSTIITVATVSEELKGRLLIFVYKSFSTSEMVETVYDVRRVLYLIAGLGIVLASFIGYIIAKRIVDPLDKLAEGVRRVDRGELGLTIDIKSKDEVGELGSEFNKMSKDLKEGVEKLEKANKKIRRINQELIEGEQELIRAEKMASIGQLAGGLAHEINNPLMSMLGWSQLGQEIVEKNEESGGLDKEGLDNLKRILKTIEEGTYRCKVVTESLLKLSRQIDVTERKHSDINKLIEDVLVSPLIYQLEFKNFAIKKRFQVPLPEVNINVGQLQQAFFDLLSNAAQAMNKGGELTITTNCIDNKFVNIQLQDTGKGISDKDIDKVFNPFFTTRKLGEGMGLGLTVVYGIISHHGGRIMVESELDEGTRLTISLPVAKSERAA